jgi:hypothetical protein
MIYINVEGFKCRKLLNLILGFGFNENKSPWTTIASHTIHFSKGQIKGLFKKKIDDKKVEMIINYHPNSKKTHNSKVMKF